MTFVPPSPSGPAPSSNGSTVTNLDEVRRARGSASRTGTGKGEFFAIDRRAWARVCTLGMNAAVAYLVQVRGTGADQRTTSWSVNAIESYTGIGRPNAQKAIKALEQAGLVHIVQTGTRPRYRIVPAHEVPGCDGYPTPALEAAEQNVFDQLGHRYVPKSGSSSEWDTPRPRQIADQIVAKGQARLARDGVYIPIPYDAEAAAKPDWIWLPNSLIDGAGDSLAAPVELLRQTRNVAPLRLFVDLYHGQTTLSSTGGIHWRSIRQEFTRQIVGERGEFIVYGFVPGETRVWRNKPFVRPHITGNTEAELDEAMQKVFFPPGTSSPAWAWLRWSGT
jgi:hypothetical protein